MVHTRNADGAMRMVEELRRAGPAEFVPFPCSRTHQALLATIKKVESPESGVDWPRLAPAALPLCSAVRLCRALPTGESNPKPKRGCARERGGAASKSIEHDR